MQLRSMRTLSIITFALVTHLVMGQQPSDRRENLKLVDKATYEAYKTSYPITRDTLNQYPDSVLIQGIMVDFTQGISCGYFCGCGTIKVRLTEKVESYQKPFIYVAHPCRIDMTDELTKVRSWTLYKLPMNDTRCYWTEVPMNKFDTSGLPFYVMKNHK
jgi:hypothetical protein